MFFSNKCIIFITVIFVRILELVKSAKNYFHSSQNIAHKRYEALRAYFVDGVNAHTVAKRFGYTHRGFTTLITDFNKKLESGTADTMFFVETVRGRKKSAEIASFHDIIIQMRQTNHSVDEIKTLLDSKCFKVSEKTIFNIIRKAGFPRLERRTKKEKQDLQIPVLTADKSVQLDFSESENFKSNSGGILSLLPYIVYYGIREIIEQSGFPGTKQISALSSILSFVALKASNVRRYSSDNVWCMDRGSGLFAGLNVLPKAAWFTSYSSRVTTDMNKTLLKKLSQKWDEMGLLSDTVNLDFTTIPYWGDSAHLENNWSGKRTKALPSLLAVLSQDSESGIVDYGDTNILHKNESAVILEFLDFRRKNSDDKSDLKYLVFDSKFTNYQNLSPSFLFSKKIKTIIA